MGVAGATDVQSEQISGESQLVVKANRAQLARYGLNVSQVMEIVSAAIGGEEVSQVIEGQKRFQIYLSFAFLGWGMRRQSASSQATEK